MTLFKKLISLSLLTSAPFCFSANNGLITQLNFAGETMGSHPNIVQVQIAGGFEGGTCNNQTAAIRKTDEHLISAVLAAYAMGKPIEVYLDQSDIYFQGNNRCRISYVTF
jgi:hypothetical protein